MYRLDVWLHTNPSYTWFSESITLWRMGTLWILSGQHLLLSGTAPGHVHGALREICIALCLSSKDLEVYLNSGWHLSQESKCLETE